MDNLEILSNKIREFIPSINKNCTSIEPNSPMLNDVLLWFKIMNYKYAHFEGYYFCTYNSDEVGEPIEWDLTKPYLKDQSQKLIDFLLEEVAK